AVARATRPTVKAMLYRSMYLGSGDKQYYEKVLTILRDSWNQAGDYAVFSVAYQGVDGKSWASDDQVVEMFGILTEALKKSLDGRQEAAPYIGAAMWFLCFTRCSKVDPAALLAAATLAREIVPLMESHYGQVRSTLGIIFWLKPYAGKLLVANAWQKGPMLI